MEAPSKKRKFNVAEDGETADKELHLPVKEHSEQKSVSDVDVEEKDKTDINDVTSSDSGDDKTISRHKNTVQSESIPTSGSTISASLIDTNNCTNQLRCSLTNVSWLEMLEKTIVDRSTDDCAIANEEQLILYMFPNGAFMA